MLDRMNFINVYQFSIFTILLLSTPWTEGYVELRKYKKRSIIDLQCIIDRMLAAYN